ncbi:hypothetical protein Bca4012_064301 [Brassica carinata]
MNYFDLNYIKNINPGTVFVWQVDYMPWHFLSLQLEIYHFRSLPDDMEVSHTSPSHLANDFSRWISRTAAGTRE